MNYKARGTLPPEGWYKGFVTNLKESQSKSGHLMIIGQVYLGEKYGTSAAFFAVGHPTGGPIAERNLRDFGKACGASVNPDGSVDINDDLINKELYVFIQHRTENGIVIGANINQYKPITEKPDKIIDEITAEVPAETSNIEDLPF